jgi:hypothetical protein
MDIKFYDGKGLTVTLYFRVHPVGEMRWEDTSEQHWTNSQQMYEQEKIFGRFPECRIHCVDALDGNWYSFTVDDSVEHPLKVEIEKVLWDAVLEVRGAMEEAQEYVWK